MHLEIFVYLLCRFPGENRIYTVQRENSFTSGALPRNWPFVLVIEDRSCKNWHSDSFPRADSGCQPCGNNSTTRTNSKSTPDRGETSRLHSQPRRQDCRASSLGCLGSHPARW